LRSNRGPELVRESVVGQILARVGERRPEISRGELVLEAFRGPQLLDVDLQLRGAVVPELDHHALVEQPCPRALRDPCQAALFDAQLLGHRTDRRPLPFVLRLLLRHHPHRTLSDFR
jgi:hypothetical protein